MHRKLVVRTFDDGSNKTEEGCRLGNNFKSSDKSGKSSSRNRAASLKQIVDIRSKPASS
jgi:hypothetical protein